MFRRVAPGQGWRPRKANEDNAVSRAAEDYESRWANSRGGFHRRNPINPCVVQVRNDTSGDRAVGDVVQLSSRILNDSEVDADHLYQSAIDPITASGQMRGQRFGVMLRAVKEGDTGVHPCQVDGICLANVNVTDITHHYAYPAGGDTLNSSVLVNEFEILEPPTDTGTQLLLVRFLHLADFPVELRSRTEVPKTGSTLASWTVNNQFEFMEYEWANVGNDDEVAGDTSLSGVQVESGLSYGDTQLKLARGLWIGQLDCRSLECSDGSNYDASQFYTGTPTNKYWNLIIPAATVQPVLYHGGDGETLGGYVSVPYSAITLGSGWGYEFFRTGFSRQFLVEANEEDYEIRFAIEYVGDSGNGANDFFQVAAKDLYLSLIRFPLAGENNSD